MHKKLKIMHIVPALTKGGGERVALELMNHAVSSGHQVTLILAFPVNPLLLFYLLRPEINVIYMAGENNSKITRYIKAFFWAIRHKKTVLSQDFIHCHLTFGSFFGSLIWGLKLVCRKKHPFIVETYHSVGMPMSLYMRWAHAKMARWRDVFVLMAQDPYWDSFTKLNKNLEIAIIPNGASGSADNALDQLEKASYRKSIGIPDKCTFVIGTIGRLSKERQPWLYIPIFLHIASIFGRDVHFVIGGDGVEWNHMQKLVKESGIADQIHLPGLVLNPVQPFSIFDLYLTINVGNTTGIAAMEAALYGLPVIGVQVLKDQKEFMENWIWSSSNSIEVANKIKSLIINRQEREALASFQRDYANKHHTMQTMVSAYDNLYQRILNQSIQARKGL